MARTTIPGRGIHLLLGSGPLSGYYVAESIVAYVQGVIGSVSYEPPVETLLPRGTVIGYRFDDAWHMTSAVVRTIGVGYRRPADR